MQHHDFALFPDIGGLPANSTGGLLGQVFPSSQYNAFSAAGGISSADGARGGDCAVQNRAVRSRPKRYESFDVYCSLDSYSSEGDSSDSGSDGGCDDLGKDTGAGRTKKRSPTAAAAADGKGGNTKQPHGQQVGAPGNPSGPARTTRRGSNGSNGGVSKRSRSRPEELKRRRQVRWSPQEDQHLLDMLAVHGKRWLLVAKELNGRSSKNVRERYLNHLQPGIVK